MYEEAIDFLRTIAPKPPKLILYPPVIQEEFYYPATCEFREVDLKEYIPYDGKMFKSYKFRTSPPEAVFIYDLVDIHNLC